MIILVYKLTLPMMYSEVLSTQIIHRPARTRVKVKQLVQTQEKNCYIDIVHVLNCFHYYYNLEMIGKHLL